MTGIIFENLTLKALCPNNPCGYLEKDLFEGLRKEASFKWFS